MPIMVNIEEIKLKMEEFRVSQEAMAEDSEMGAVYRAQIAVCPAMTIWRATEMNRDTDPNTVMNAILSLFAGTLSGEIMSTNGDIDAKFRTLNKFLQGLGEETATMLTGNSQYVMHNDVFDIKECGNA